MGILFPLSNQYPIPNLGGTGSGTDITGMSLPLSN